jgi:hypothetical protein
MDIVSQVSAKVVEAPFTADSKGHLLGEVRRLFYRREGLVDAQTPLGRDALAR